MANAKPSYITDFGKPLEVTKDGTVEFMVDRYGVWCWDQWKKKYQVEDTGSDLELLQKEYGPCEVIPVSCGPQTQD